MRKKILFIHLVWIIVFLIMLTGFSFKASAQQDLFKYNEFSLSLPEGWTTQEIAKGSEKEVVGNLKSEKIAGTSVLVLCYRG